MSRKQMVAAAVPTLLMLGLLALQLVTVERQRRIAARQEVRARVSLEAVREQAGALLRQGRAVAPDLGAGLRRADRLVRALDRTDSPEAIAEAGQLAERLQTADLAGRVELIARGVIGTLQEVRDLNALTRAIAAVAREAGTDVEVLKTATLDFKSESLRLQRETLGVLRRSLAVQEETLVRIRNIDERTGGVAPAPAP